MQGKAENKLELYIHIPFCVKKCAYCDFLSFPSREGERRAYVDALLQEIQAVHKAGEGAKDRVTSVFFGGGTPSLLPEGWIGEIMACIRTHFALEPGAEITIEANPGTLDLRKLEGYRRAGINRLSIGCQSTEDGELKKLGRIHTWREFQENYAAARQAGFQNINVDLMSALPGQSYESWTRGLNTVAALGPEHISAYSLIIEEGTWFGAHREELDLPDEDTERRMYEDTKSILEGYGYQRYEISNYAREGYACRHNVGYWQRTPYLGFGLGAASLYRETRFRNTESMEEYLVHAGTYGALRKETERLTLQEQMEEFMILGLRMCAGVSENAFFRRFGLTLEEKYRTVLEKYQGLGLLQRERGSVFLTEKGISLSNVVLAEFLQ